MRPKFSIQISTRSFMRQIVSPVSLSPRELDNMFRLSEGRCGVGRSCPAAARPRARWTPPVTPLAPPPAISTAKTFRALKENELAKYGEYRTRRLVLEALGRLADRR